MVVEAAHEAAEELELDLLSRPPSEVAFGAAR
jgi:hypothetical protein